MVLVIDNYDSFTYNLVQALGGLGARVVVRRNDSVTPREIRLLGPDRIVISPGPGAPRQAGVSCEVLRAFLDDVPILGVCLGHQCLAEAFGWKVVRATAPRHGKTSLVHHDGRTLFEGLQSPFPAMRYNSLIVLEPPEPGELQVSARSETGEVMGLRHRRRPVEGVQFHPESYRTPAGWKLLANFLKGSHDCAPVSESVPPGQLSLRMGGPNPGTCPTIVRRGGPNPGTGSHDCEPSGPNRGTG